MPVSVKKAEGKEGGIEVVSGDIDKKADEIEIKVSAAQKKSEDHVNELITSWALSARKTDELATECLMACLVHYEKYGDARPIDRFIKEAPSTVNTQPYVFWVKSNSPIYWDAKGNVRVRKQTTDDGQPNPDYKPLNMEHARSVPWNMTDEYKKLQRKPLEPFSAKTFFDRIHNLRKTFQNMQKDDSKREFDTSYGDTSFVDKFLADLSDFIVPYEKKAERFHANPTTAPRKARSTGTTTKRKNVTIEGGVAGNA